MLGHVTDPTGAVVPDADVTITNLSTNISQKAKTSGVGDFVFVNITPGHYSISVAHAGFKTSQTADVKLDVDATLRQNFALEIGDAKDEVTVSAESQMIQADNATSGSVIESKMIENLPISGRDFTNLLKLQAGATTVQGSSQLYWAQHGLNDNFTSVSVNGARTESVSYLVDGITDNDQFFSTANNIPISDAIAEFKVQNGLYSPEYGQGSAQINVAIKQGGNQYHGSAYDYFQSDIFQPRDPYLKYEKEVLGADVDTSKQPFKQNQYGFTLSGPISVPKLYEGKEKSFFFFAYEIGRRKKTVQGQATVPSAQERTGDFSDWKDASGTLLPLYNPATQAGDNPSTRTAFANNNLGSSLSPIAKNYLALYPSPTITKSNMAACVAGGCINYFANVKRPLDSNNATFRVDHHLNDRDLFYFSAVLAEQKLHNTAIMPLTGEIKSQKNKLFALNWQRIVTPNIVNEARVGYNWQYWQNGSDAANVDWGTKLGFANEVTNPDFYSIPTLTMTGFQTLGNSNAGWHQKENIYQFVDNLKFIHGRHTLTLGADVRRYLLNMTTAYSSEGSVDFNGAYTSSNPVLVAKPGTTGAGSSVADLLLGNPIGVSAPLPFASDLFNVRATAWNFFAADDFRITPRLTVNLGLRYEIPPAFHSANDSGVALDLSNGGSFKWASKSTYDLVKSISGVNPYLVGYTSNNKLSQSNHANFAPRVGFAWRPLSTDRFVVRGGYGLFYDLQNQWYSLTTFDDIKTYLGTGSYPTSTGYTSAAPNKLDTLWTAVDTDYSWFQLPYWRSGPQINWPKNKSSYNQQWSLDTQYAINQGLLLDIGYIGSHALHQPGYWYYNAAQMTSVDDDCNHYRDAAEAPASCLSDPNFVPADQRTNFHNIRSNAYALANIFSGSYNSLQVRLNQRYAHGMNYQLNYTWSRALDTVSAINNIEGSQLTLQNNNCPKCDRGPAAYDQTHRLVSSGSYQLPVGKGRRWSAGKVGDWVVGGWDFTGIYTVASGFPFTVTNTGDSTLGQDGVRRDLRRPNQTGDPHSSNITGTYYNARSLKSNIYHWYNPTAFTPAAGNVYGNTTRNSLRGPFSMRGDITFAKNFPITDKHNIMYRFEMFNVLSTWHASPGEPKNTLSDSQAGSLVNIATDSAGNSLAEQAQPGTRQLWNPRVIQMTLKYTF